MSCYDLLRPWTAIDRCDCVEITSIVLVDLMTDNPIHCFDCRKEVDPESLKLDSELVEDIARWYSVYQSLYALWLDSGEYEAYAKDRLLDSSSQVNIDGLLLAQRLTAHIQSYYWWFHDTDDGEPSHCPQCSKKLDLDVKYGTGKCSDCRVVV